MSAEPLVILSDANERGELIEWGVPAPFLAHRTAACELCAHEPDRAMIAAFGDEANARQWGYADAWWLCDNCGQPTCLGHAYWWTYGAGGSRILCKTCLDRMREIDAKLVAEGEGDEQPGTVMHCGTGKRESMRTVS